MADRDVIIVDGAAEVTRAFATGFVAGCGADRDPVLYGGDLSLQHDSLGARLRALLPGGHHETILIVDTRIARSLETALRAAQDCGLRVVERARLEAAWFKFAAETPSRDAAQVIHETLSDLPPGVTLVEHEREELDPRAHGVHLYAPVHEYTFRAKGKVIGAIEGVVSIHDRLRGMDFVFVQSIHLDETAQTKV
jgi:hypothetical protein